MAEAECHQTFLNVLMMKDEGMTSSCIIREFWRTARCDKVHNMVDVRKDYADYIKQASGSEESLKRILTYRQNQVDESIAAQAIWHHSMSHKAQIQKSLTWPTFAWYNIVYRHKYMFTQYSIEGFGFQAARNSVRAIREGRCRTTTESSTE